jgi:DnaK suppressor protein
MEEQNMKSDLLSRLTERLQRERRALVDEVSQNNETFRIAAEDREPELEEHAQQERDSRVLERIDDRQQNRIRDIDNALARVEAGTYGNCDNCGRTIPEERLRSMPTTMLCADCSAEAEKQSPEVKEGMEETAQAGKLPPDLAQLDDYELQDYLTELIREDGKVEMQELQIMVRKGVVYLEGAIPSEAEHEVLLNILTDVAGVQELSDHLDVQPLAWEREDRSKAETAEDVPPGKIPDQEPYGGTEDIVLTKEEGVPYEPPIGPPPSPHRKD